MTATDQKQDYRAERFTYSGGTYPEYVAKAHPAVRVIHQATIAVAQMSISEILEACSKKPSQPQTLGEDGVLVQKRRGRPRKNAVKVAPPVVLDADGNVVKRKRGRPRKNPLPVAVA